MCASPIFDTESGVFPLSFSFVKLKKEVMTMELQKVQRTTLTMKEAAEYLGVSYWLINQLVRRKEIPC